MLTLWALAVMLSAQAGTPLALIPPELSNFRVGIHHVPPISEVTPQISTVLPQLSSVFRARPPSKPPAETAGGRCATVARYQLSESRLHEYLSTTLQMHSEKLLSCEEFNLAGVVGMVLSTVTESRGLLPLLSSTAPLDIFGGAGLGGTLGKGSNKKPPPNHSPVSKATKPLDGLLSLGQEAQGRQPTSGAKNPLRGLLSTVGLSKVAEGTAGRVDQLKDSTQGVVNRATEGVLNGATQGVLNGAAQGVLSGATQGLLNGAVQDMLNSATEGVLNSVVPQGVNDAVKGLLANGIVQDLLDTLTVQKVTVEDLKLTTTDDGILAHASITIILGGKGPLGPVISLVGFQVQGEIALKIGIVKNDTQCVTLQVQSKDITANEVSFLLLKTLESSLPLPLPLPLDSLVSTLLTAELNTASQESKSCDIDFSDFNKCKNSTGLFNYHVQDSKISPDGLLIFYCADLVLKGKSSPVPGGRLPPHPKNANVSLTLAHTVLGEIIAHCAKQRFQTKAGLVVIIAKLAYSYRSGNTIQVTYYFTVEKNGEQIANGETAFVVLCEANISEGKMNTRLTLKSPTHYVALPEPRSDVENVIAETLKNFWSCFTGTIKQVNVPTGVASNPLINVKVTAISKALQAAN